MPNSAARFSARPPSGSHTATSITLVPRFRQATRWYQLIMPAPAMAILRGSVRVRGVVMTQSSSGSGPGNDTRRRGVEEVQRRGVEMNCGSVPQSSRRIASHPRDDLLGGAVEGKDEQRVGTERLDREDARGERSSAYAVRRRLVEILGADSEDDPAAQSAEGAGRPTRQADGSGAEAQDERVIRGFELGGDEVHRRVAEKARNEGIGRIAVDLERRADL